MKCQIARMITAPMIAPTIAPPPTYLPVRLLAPTPCFSPSAGTRSGVLTTDSGLTFTGDAMGNFLALDSTDGKTLWHAGSGSKIASSPITYQLDGRQYVVTSSGGVLFVWTLPAS